MGISTNPKPTIYGNLYKNTGRHTGHRSMKSYCCACETWYFQIYRLLNHYFYYYRYMLRLCEIPQLVISVLLNLCGRSENLSYNNITLGLHKGHSFIYSHASPLSVRGGSSPMFSVLALACACSRQYYNQGVKMNTMNG